MAVGDSVALGGGAMKWIIRCGGTPKTGVYLWSTYNPTLRSTGTMHPHSEAWWGPKAGVCVYSDRRAAVRDAHRAGGRVVKLTNSKRRK